MKYEKQMPLEAIHRITGLMHLHLVEEIKLVYNHGFWDIEVKEKSDG
jgi:hypothetical protein